MSVNKKPNDGLNRMGRYSICEVFEYIDASPQNGQRVRFYGNLMHLRSTRLLNFRVHGIECVTCGARGAFFAKEKWGNDPPHLNLYAFDKQGHPILMTRDHIKPRSKGGTNHLHNLQPMCVACNSAKGDDWKLKDKIRFLFRKLFYRFKKEY